MRNIEFRAWQKSRQIMWYAADMTKSDTITFDGRYIEHELTDTLYGGDIRYADRTDDFELLQFTGAYDVDKKKIFEEDIVHAWGGEYAQGYWEFDYICIVKWMGMGFDLVRIKDGVGLGWGFADSFEHIQVLGNTRQNSELLQNGVDA